MVLELLDPEFDGGGVNDLTIIALLFAQARDGDPYLVRGGVVWWTVVGQSPARRKRFPRFAPQLRDGRLWTPQTGIYRGHDCGIHL